jgi:hypothetical protein
VEDALHNYTKDLAKPILRSLWWLEQGFSTNCTVCLARSCDGDILPLKGGCLTVA